MKGRIFLFLFLILEVKAIYKICIDPGHGGSDSGALGTYCNEKDANLMVGLKLRDLFIAHPDFDVIMTRNTDEYVDLATRVAIANNNHVNRFISIHHNAYNQNTQGTETYCHPNASSYSFDLRDKIHARLLQAFGYPDRGVKTAEYYVLTYTDSPAVLGEASFIDYTGTTYGNESYKFVFFPAHSDSEAWGYFEGTKDHYCVPVEEARIHVEIIEPEHGGTWFVGNTYQIKWHVWCANNFAMIVYSVPKVCAVSLKLYDISGRLMTTFVNDKVNPGIYTIKLNAKNYPKGCYFIKFNTNEYNAIKKLIILH